jgi:hypothetical protein
MDLIRADIFCGAGYVQWVWQQAQLRALGKAYPDAYPRTRSQAFVGTVAYEHYRLLDEATFRWLMRPAPKHTWRWPDYVRGVDDVLRVTRDGFDLVTRFVGAFGDTPIYALTRDGVLSPPGVVGQSAAHAARVEYFGHHMKLNDGTLLYKRKAAA